MAQYVGCSSHIKASKVKQFCDYGTCDEQAVTKGFILVKTKDGKHVPKTVYACEKHKKLPSFFEDN